MERKNIYDLVILNYNIFNEVKKINDLLTHEDFFYSAEAKSKVDGGRVVKQYLFFDFADKVLFQYLPVKGTCMSLAEFMTASNAILKFGEYGNLSEARVVNYLEVVENLLNIYFRRQSQLRKAHGYDYYHEQYKKLSLLMNELERHMRIVKKVKKDVVILSFPSNK